MMCDDCQYIEQCKKEYGEYREDGDDYRAVVGSHFCRKSWDPFYEMMNGKVTILVKE